MNKIDIMSLAKRGIAEREIEVLRARRDGILYAIKKLDEWVCSDDEAYTLPDMVKALIKEANDLIPPLYRDETAKVHK